MEKFDESTARKFNTAASTAWARPIQGRQVSLRIHDCLQYVSWITSWKSCLRSCGKIWCIKLL